MCSDCCCILSAGVLGMVFGGWGLGVVGCMCLPRLGFILIVPFRCFMYPKLSKLDKHDLVIDGQPPALLSQSTLFQK